MSIDIDQWTVLPSEITSSTHYKGGGGNPTIRIPSFFINNKECGLLQRYIVIVREQGRAVVAIFVCQAMEHPRFRNKEFYFKKTGTEETSTTITPVSSVKYRHCSSYYNTITNGKTVKPLRENYYLCLFTVNIQYYSKNFLKVSISQTL